MYPYVNECMKREQEKMHIEASQRNTVIAGNKKKDEIKLSEFLKSQKGSRIYQRKIKKIKTEELEGILKALEFNYAELLISVYGNYFCQKLYTICYLKQREYILKNLKKDIETVGKDYCGSQALQALLMQINSPEELYIFNSIFTKNTIISLSLDSHGCFIIQKLYKVYDEVSKENLSNILIESLDTFLSNQNGFRMVYYFLI